MSNIFQFKSALIDFNYHTNDYDYTITPTDWVDVDVEQLSLGHFTSLLSDVYSGAIFVINKPKLFDAYEIKIPNGAAIPDVGIWDMTPGPDQQSGEPGPIALNTEINNGFSLVGNEGSSYTLASTSQYYELGQTPLRYIKGTTTISSSGGVLIGLPDGDTNKFVGIAITSDNVDMPQVITDIQSQTPSSNYDLLFLMLGKFGPTTYFGSYTTLMGGNLVSNMVILSENTDITGVPLIIDMENNIINSPIFEVGIDFQFNRSDYNIYFILVDDAQATGVHLNINDSYAFGEIPGLLGGAQIIPGTPSLPEGVEDKRWYQVVNPHTYGQYVAEENDYVMFYNNHQNILPIRGLNKAYVDTQDAALYDYVDVAVASSGLDAVKLFLLQRNINAVSWNEAIKTIEGITHNTSVNDYPTGFSILILDNGMSFESAGGYNVGNIIINNGNTWVEYQVGPGELFRQEFLDSRNTYINKVSGTPEHIGYDGWGGSDFENTLIDKNYQIVVLENSSVLQMTVLNPGWQLTIDTTKAETSIVVGTGIGDPGRTELTFYAPSSDLLNGTGIVRVRADYGIPALYCVKFMNGTSIDGHSDRIYMTAGSEFIIRFYILYGDIFWKIEGHTLDRNPSVTFTTDNEVINAPHNMIEFVMLNSSGGTLDGCVFNLYYNFKPDQIITFQFGANFTNLHLQLDSQYHQLRLSPFATVTSGDSVTYRIRSDGMPVLIATTIN